MARIKDSRMDELVNRVLGQSIMYMQQGWTQGVMATDATGASVHPWDHKAVCWCAIGAINRAICDIGYSPDLESMARARVRDTLEAQNRGYFVSQFNDEVAQSADEVIEIFQLAILPTTGLAE